MSTAGGVRITAMACAYAEELRPLAQVFEDEGVALTDDARTRLGIDEVATGLPSSGPGLAMDCTTRALEDAGVTGKQIDLIVDYSMLPQHFLVPVWNLGNKLQHELGATRAFTLGFSGGGTSNFHVALRFATDLLSTNDQLHTALLFGADTAIPGNRIINQDQPVTVLGDGASAMVLSTEEEGTAILATELISDGAYHDVCYVPGGALAQLDQDDRSDLYRLQIDATRLAAAPTAETLDRLARQAAERTGIDLGTIHEVIVPNISAADDAGSRAIWNAPASPASDANRRRHGHVQATDLVANLQSAVHNGSSPGDVLMVASHGMGFTAGVSLLRI